MYRSRTGALPHDLHVFPHLARHYGDRGARRGREPVGDHRVGARTLRHERAGLVHLADGPRRHDAVRRDPESRELDRVVRHRVSGGVGDLRLEEHDVTRAHGLRRGPGQGDRGDRVRKHLDPDVGRSLFGGEGEGRATGPRQAEHPECVHPRHRRIGGAPANPHVVPGGARGVRNQWTEPDLGPCVDVARQIRDLDGGDRRVRDGDRNLDHDRRLRAPVGVLRIPRHHGDQGVLAGPKGLHDPGGVHPDRAAAPREEHHRAVHGVAVGVAHLSLEGGVRSHLQRQFARGDDEFGGLGTGGLLGLLLRERGKGEEEQGDGRNGDEVEAEGSGHGAARAGMRSPMTGEYTRLASATPHVYGGGASRFRRWWRWFSQ